MLTIKIINKSNNPLPKYGTIASAGADLYANNPEPIILDTLDRALVPTGIFIELPMGYEAQIRPRSGLAVKHGISIVNAPGTIDADYRGEIMVPLINLGKEPFTVVNGERIAQMVIAQHEQITWESVEILSETVRGAGGFGHTGKQ